ncbi:hypothetical protein ACFXKY_15585 [Streptomyces canus]
MTHDHSDVGTPADPDQQTPEESDGGEELLPPAASDWDPEADAYQLSTS